MCIFIDREWYSTDEHMDDPYYSYAPTLLPSRPIALIGLPGARVPMVGAMLSVLTGLPFLDLERLVEHHSGQSLAQITFEQGQDGLAAHERRILIRVLAESPPPIIALSTATLTAPKTRHILRQRADVFYVKRPVKSCLQALQRDPSRCWPMHPSQVQTTDALHGVLTANTAGYHSAQHTIQAADRHPQRIALEIIDTLSAA